MADLGIDMGGTATRWVLLGPDGAVVAQGVAPGASGLVYDAAARAAFEAALGAVRAALPAPPLRAHLGVTGAGFGANPALAARAASALGMAVPAVTLENDLELAWRAAFGEGPGHLVLAGTGSVAMGRGASGAAPVVLGGRGVLIDDRGSASWIGLRALSAVCRRLDECGAPAGLETLARHLHAAIGGEDWDTIRAWVYGRDRGQIGLLARAVAAAAAEGCATARGILDEAAGELAWLAETLVARCGPAPLMFTGGVLALDPRIRAALENRLAALAPAFGALDAATAAARHAAARQNATSLLDERAAAARPDAGHPDTARPDAARRDAHRDTARHAPPHAPRTEAP